MHATWLLTFSATRFNTWSDMHFLPLILLNIWSMSNPTKFGKSPVRLRAAWWIHNRLHLRRPDIDGKQVRGVSKRKSSFRQPIRIAKLKVLHLALLARHQQFVSRPMVQVNLPQVAGNIIGGCHGNPSNFCSTTVGHRKVAPWLALILGLQRVF